MRTPRTVTRRQMLGLMGVAGATVLVARRPWSGGPDAVEQAGAAETPACVLTPAKTEGPYFVDERLIRSDIRSDPSDGTVQAGVPLTLTLRLYGLAGGCTPYPGALVDMWHCNASGLYSDEAANGTVGKKFLRGYQVTDANGAVVFTTVHPGWYSGRTIHIHFKVRTQSGTSTTYEFNSQLFFDEAVNAAVLATSPYSARSGRDTLNSTDNIFGADGGTLTVALTGDPTAGYVGTFDIGLSGLPATSTPTTTPTTTPSATTPTTTTPTTTVPATTPVSTGPPVDITGLRFVRSGLGSRVMRLSLSLEEVVTAEARLLRGGRLIARRRGTRLGPGIRRLLVVVGRRVTPGSATLELRLRNGAGTTRVLRRSVRVPRP